MVFCSVRNDVCTEVVVKITPCRLVKGYGRFGRTWTVGPEDEDEGRYVPNDLNLHQHCCENFTTTNCCPKTKARNYQSTLHKIQKERRSHSHCVHSLKSGNYGSVTFSAISVPRECTDRLAGCFLCCVVHVYAGHFRYTKIIPQQVKGKKK